MVLKKEGKGEEKGEKERREGKRNERSHGSPNVVMRQHKLRYTFVCTTWSGMEVRIVGNCPCLFSGMSKFSCSGSSHTFRSWSLCIICNCIEKCYTTMFKMSSFLVSVPYDNT